MQPFLNLIKKKLVGEASEHEEAELMRLVNTDEECSRLYVTIFLRADESDDIDWIEAEQAYVAHLAKMRLSKQFDG